MMHYDATGTLATGISLTDASYALARGKREILKADRAYI